MLCIMPDYCQCERSKRYFEEVRCCFICLNPNHVSKNCMSTRNCRHCNHKHHQSICEAVHNKNANRTRNLRMKQTMQRVTTTSSTGARKDRTVLLQTARAVAFNKENNRSIPVRILFDNGSQRSYVTDNACTFGS